MSDLDVDVVVIGAGPVGENVADRAHQQGLSAAIVEDRLVGGECSYYACIPSKALLRPVDLLAAAQRVPGVEAGPIDVAKVLERRDGFANPDDSGQADGSPAPASRCCAGTVGSPASAPSRSPTTTAPRRRSRPGTSSSPPARRRPPRRSTAWTR